MRANWGCSILAMCCIAPWLVCSGAAPVWAENSAPAPDAPRPGRQPPPLVVQIDKAKVDLDGRRLEVRMSRPAGRVKLTVYDADGFTLAEEDHDFRGRPANAPLLVTWSPTSDTPVAKIEVFAFDTEGFFKGIAIIPWSLEIPHEEVTFETNSHTIRASEEPKLESSLVLIRAALKEHGDLGPIGLFIAGHTDTRGSTAHNLDLSRRRARAIAAWFQKNGVGISVAYEGFGENALKVKTADEVDEPLNRRVDYVLSIEPPRLRGSGASAAWKRL